MKEKIKISSKSCPSFKKKSLKVIACIQARMGSTRLKKKALRKILGKTLIEHIFNRLKTSREINDIVLATSLKKENDILVKHAKDIGLKYYRGSEEDLVSRYYETCKEFKANAIVRITGDCPLVDPKLVDKMVKIYRRNYKKIDLVTNIFPRTFPDGLDTEILPLSTLKKLNEEVKDTFYRESLTVYIMENSQKFRISNFKNSKDLSSMRLTIDYLKDLVFVKKIYRALYQENKIFDLAKILNFLKKSKHI